MEMNEIKTFLPNCPRCGRHCPIDQTSCPRGQELVEKLLNGSMTLEEATAPVRRDGEHGEHESHEGHKHGHHHGDHHGDHEHKHHHAEDHGHGL